MSSNRETLQSLIDSIRHIEARYGRSVSDEDIANKLSISKDELDEYKKRGKDFPDRFTTMLLDSYKLKIEYVELVSIRDEPDPDDDEFWK